ncbi:MAG: ribonuclease D [Verrucomicrobiaceae bacterium]
MASTHYFDPLELVASLPNGPGEVGLDLEADSLYRYSERICLVQVCYQDQVALVDPLGDANLEPLVAWIKKASVWMHGADYDMALMIKEWGFVPPMLYDTQIAAQLLGHERFGYAGLVEQYFGVELSKSSQKADWGKRPLSEKMLEYAINDVRYLLPLASRVETRLKELGRYEWFLESCEAAQARVLNRELEEKQSWRISGSGKLKPRGLVFLKEVWAWRDQEAAAWNRPSFMVAGNKQLIQWSEDLALDRRISYPPKLRPDRRKRLEDAIKRARTVPEEEWPKRPKRERRSSDPEFETRLKSIMSKRNEIATGLEIDPSVIASRPVLEQIVGGRAEPEDILLSWQRTLLDL